MTINGRRHVLTAARFIKTAHRLLNQLKRVSTRIFLSDNCYDSLGCGIHFRDILMLQCTLSVFYHLI